MNYILKHRAQHLPVLGNLPIIGDIPLLLYHVVYRTMEEPLLYSLRSSCTTTKN